MQKFQMWFRKKQINSSAAGSHTYNPSTQEAEPGEAQVRAQPGQTSDQVRTCLKIV